jgi:methylthioribose-1-phosphate isomerase
MVYARMVGPDSRPSGEKMHARIRKNMTRIGVALGLLAGSSAALAECFSQTIAKETYYACSGVLTIVPAEGTRATETGETKPRDAGAEATPKNLPGAGTPALDKENSPP